MIDPVTGWFEVTQYTNKKAIMICELGRNYVAGTVSMASRDHVWSRRIIPWSQV